MVLITIALCILLILAVCSIFKLVSVSEVRQLNETSENRQLWAAIIALGLAVVLVIIHFTTAAP